MNRRFFIKTITLAAASVSAIHCRFGASEQGRSNEDILWDIFLFAAAYWGNEKHLNLTRNDFNALIRAASIDKECDALVAAYKKDLAHTGSRAATLERIYFGSVVSNDLKTKTIKAFITINLMHGGFRVWGLKNYPGFIGGSYAVPQAGIPYRIYEN